MSKKTLFLLVGAVVLLGALIGARSLQVYIQEQSEAHQRAEQMAKAQEAMKQLQHLGYGQMPPNFSSMPNLANMNIPVMPGGNYSPAAQMAMVKLIQKGVSMAVASYLVQAKPQVLSQSNNSLRYSLTFPDGIISESTIKLTPNQSYSPTPSDVARAQKIGQQIYRVQFSAKTESETKGRMTLHYFVPNPAIPANLQQRLNGQSAASFHLIASVYAEGSLGMDVASDTSVEVTKEILKQTAEHGKLSKEFPVPLARLVDVLNALKKETEHLDWIDQLNELEDCAKNPTNPLTQKAFQNDPSYQQQTLDSIKDARSDASQMTAMRFLNLATSVATDLVDGPLGAITSPVSSYNDATLKNLADDRVNEAKKGLSDCNPYKGYGDKYPPLHGTLEYLYKRIGSNCKDGNCNKSEINKKVSGEFDLGSDEFGKNNSGVNGTATLDQKEDGSFTNTKCHGESHQTLAGPLNIYAQLAGSGSVGWVRLDIGGESLLGTSQSSQTCGSSPPTHDEWNNGGFNLSCKFTNVDLRRGGTYSSFVDADQGYGTCKIELAPK